MGNARLEEMGNSLPSTTLEATLLSATAKVYPRYVTDLCITTYR